MPRLRPLALSLSILSILILSTFSFAAVPDRISGPVTSSDAVRLSAGVSREARPEFDRGPVDPSLKLSYMTLQTVPSAAQKKALNKLLADQQNLHSPSYHKWLTPEKYADRFGLSPNDVKTLTSWLRSQGFSIVRTARARNWIVFSGTAAQVEQTFQIQIHSFNVNGEQHYANTAPPVIPKAFSGVVVGVRGFNDFRPKSQARRANPGYTFSNSGSNFFFIAPGDVATMYDINNLYSAGIDGTGQTLAVIGETGIFQSDLTNFRQNFGLSPISCTVSSDIIQSCNTPNFQYVLVNGTPNDIFSDLPEADIDIEWSGAAARNAQIIYVTANATGVLDSLYFAIDNDVSPVITMSYTAPCEYFEIGSFAADEAELAKSTSFGITFMNSSGDTGNAECDYAGQFGALAEVGYQVGYPASSQYATGVGGTLIPYTEYTSTYWNTSNSGDGNSAKSYIPEQPWNDSLEFAYFCEANKTNSFCSGNGIGNGPLLTDWQNMQVNVFFSVAAGGGGVSNCVTVDVNGICSSGFPQPAWQSGISMSAVNPSGAGMVNSTPARLSPDVSLMASANWPGYLVCTQINGSAGGGSSCDSPSTGIADMLTQCLVNNNFSYCTIFGGTSVASPIFAGIVALLNQDVVANGIQPAPGLGNINPTLYLLAGTPANGAFNQVATSKSGDYSNGAWCLANYPNAVLGVPGDQWPAAMNCPPSGTNLLEFDSFNADPTTGYNLTTGLGSVNASHLAAAWIALGAATSTALISSPNPSNYGAPVTFTATVTTVGVNAPTGTVTFYNGSTSIGTGTLSTVSGFQVATFTTSTLAPTPTNPDSITAVYGGDSNNAASTSNAVLQTVNAPTFTLGTPSTPAAPLAGQSTTSTITVTATSGATFAADVTFTCNGLPDATVGCSAPTITATTPSPVIETVTITTTGPNTGTANGVRRRADNRMPWLPLSIPLAGAVMVGLSRRKMSKHASALALCSMLVLAGFLIACGSSSPPVSVSNVTANPTSVFPNYAADSWPNQTSTFSATVTNDPSNSGVTWAISSGPGSIDSKSGIYTAPTITAGMKGATVNVTATSVKDTTKSASGSVTLNAATIPTAVAGAPYSITVTATETTTQNTSSAISLTVN